MMCLFFSAYNGEFDYYRTRKFCILGVYRGRMCVVEKLATGNLQHAELGFVVSL